MRIALAQLNPTIGDFSGNLGLMDRAIQDASALGADLVVFPELMLTGYPPRDLLNRRSFVTAAQQALSEWLTTLPEDHPSLLIGHVVERENSDTGRRLWNAAVLVQNKKQVSIHPKTLLPSYDVFDEDRWFEPLSEKPHVIDINGTRVGVTVCEDIWTLSDSAAVKRYHRDPLESVIEAGATLVVNLSASPFSVGKYSERRALLMDQAQNHGVPIVYVNQVGGNDELIFDGRSLAVDGSGKLVAQSAAFKPDLQVLDTENWAPITLEEAMDEEDEVIHALVLGVRDYFSKIGASKAVIGLSGGIDSALTAVIAADALGSENVVGIAMPSEFSSEHSLDDAAALAKNLDIEYRVVPIQAPLNSFRTLLKGILGEPPWGVTDENLQARIRGIILMAYSNRHGHLVLSTGNKSEVATGYCTLYGDMCGGMAVLSDVPKTLVYRVARRLNKAFERIPVSTIEKPPSAELRPDQRDDQSLPPYEVLDQILELHVVQQQDQADIVGSGFPATVVDQILGLVDRSEYKRRQMPVGLRVTTKAFGSGRRLPIAQKWSKEMPRDLDG